MAASSRLGGLTVEPGRERLADRCRIAWRGGRPTGPVGSRRPHWWRGRAHRSWPSPPAPAIGWPRPPSSGAPSRRCGGCAPASATGPTPTTSPRRCTCGPCPRWPRSGASRRPAPGSCRSPATCAPTTCAAAPAAASLLDRLVQREATERGGRRPTRTGELDLDDLIARLDPDRREAFVLTQVAGPVLRRGGRWCARCRSARSARASPAPAPTCSTRSPSDRGGRLRLVGASSSSSWTRPLLATPLPPSMPVARRPGR